MGKTDTGTGGQGNIRYCLRSLTGHRVPERLYHGTDDESIVRSVKCGSNLGSRGIWQHATARGCSADR
jgi:hypothetical protein